MRRSGLLHVHPLAGFRGFEHGVADVLGAERVADHLQRMGLGWRVTSALLERYPALELDMATRAPELRVAGADADRRRYARLFRAAKRINSRA